VDTLSYRTISGNTATADKKWFIVDASGHHVGRLASVVAKVLRGKYKTCYTPHADCGDNVIIINAEKVALDALQGVAYVNDKQIQKIVVRYGSPIVDGGLIVRVVPFVSVRQMPLQRYLMRKKGV
jgi:ribosomal protein L13